MISNIIEVNMKKLLYIAAESVKNVLLRMYRTFVQIIWQNSISCLQFMPPKKSMDAIAH